MLDEDHHHRPESMIPGATPPNGGQEAYYDYSAYSHPSNSTAHWQYQQYQHQHQQQQQQQQQPQLEHQQHQQAIHPHQQQQQQYYHVAQQPMPSMRPSHPLPQSTAIPVQPPPQQRQHQQRQHSQKASQPRPTKRKRVAPSNDAESDDESTGNLEDFLSRGGISVGMGGLGIPSSNAGGGVGRLPGACTHCKKLKMKCEFSKNSDTCRRCHSGGHVCIVEGRKPRTAPNKREYLLAQIRQKDAIIESLLKQLHNPYVATPLSIASYKMATSPSDERKEDVLGWLEKLESSLRSDRQFAASPSLPATPTSPKDTANVFTSGGGGGGDSSTGGVGVSGSAQGSGREQGVGGGSGAPGPGAMSFARKHYPSLTPVIGSRRHADGNEVSEEGEGVSEDDGNGRDKDNDHDDDDDRRTVMDEHRTALPDSNAPLGLIANLSLGDRAPPPVTGSGGGTDERKGKSTAARGAESGKKIKGGETVLDPDELDYDNIGVANEAYFQPGPAMDLGQRAMLIEQHSPPEILVHGLVEPKDVATLFQVFYEKVNPFVGLLDPVLHTPATTFARCPFLFTVVCAVSSRYYPPKSEIYPIAMHFAKHAAANALIDGWKSVELVQAYILMSIYAVPAKKWEEDRSWLYTGLAIRIATDLNLHRAPTIQPSPLPQTPNVSRESTSGSSSSTAKSSARARHKEVKEREILNKTRVWMICFNMDRSTATQFGKPFTIQNDFITLAATDFYSKSPYNDPYDIHLAGYTSLLQIVAKFHEDIFSDPREPGGLNKKIDFRTVTLAHDDHLINYHNEWDRRFKESSDPHDPSCKLRTYLLPFLVAYSRLVMFSFGFQRAFELGMKDEDRIFFTKCLDSAKTVVKVFIELLVPTGYMRYSPDGHFIFSSFASAFLLKFLRPEFSSLLSSTEAQEIFELIGRLIQTLSSPELAIDDRHTPKLYARFLAGLLSRYRRSDHKNYHPVQVNPSQSGSGPGADGNGGGNSGPSHPDAGQDPGAGRGQPPFGSGGFEGHGFDVSGYGGSGGGHGSYGGGYGYGSASVSDSSSIVNGSTNLNSRESATSRASSGSSHSPLHTQQQSHYYQGRQQSHSPPGAQRSSSSFLPRSSIAGSSETAMFVAEGSSRPTTFTTSSLLTAQQQQQGTFEELLGVPTLPNHDGSMMVVDPDPTLSAMYALKNPTWWDNMMMPGFSWPDPQAVLPLAHGQQPSMAYTRQGPHAQQNVYGGQENGSNVNGFGHPPSHDRMFEHHPLVT